MCAIRWIPGLLRQDLRLRVAVLTLLITIAMLPPVPLPGMAEGQPWSHAYGVFLSLDDSDLNRLAGFETVVIDAQYFSADSIRTLRQSGHKVLTYLNLGAIEDFRSYYDAWRDLFLGPYENWPEEQWVDVSNIRWQRFLLEDLAPAMVAKGVDGFFVDNCDVYALFPREGIYEGLATVLTGLKSLRPTVIINSGDAFLNAYFQRNGQVNTILSGINQETVLTAIDFATDTFTTSTPQDRTHYENYVSRYAAEGAGIYLLEYTRDPELAKAIGAYCRGKGYQYYISDSIELD